MKSLHSHITEQNLRADDSGILDSFTFTFANLPSSKSHGTI